MAVSIKLGNATIPHASAPVKYALKWHSGISLQKAWVFLFLYPANAI